MKKSHNFSKAEKKFGAFESFIDRFWVFEIWNILRYSRRDWIERIMKCCDKNNENFDDVYERSLIITIGLINIVHSAEKTAFVQVSK